MTSITSYFFCKLLLAPHFDYPFQLFLRIIKLLKIFFLNHTILLLCIEAIEKTKIGGAVANIFCLFQCKSVAPKSFPLDIILIKFNFYPQTVIKWMWKVDVTVSLFCHYKNISPRCYVDGETSP